MESYLALFTLLTGFSGVLCGLLTPKDASYGYVPRDTDIVKLPSDQDLWRPYANVGFKPDEDRDSIVVNAPDVNNLSRSPFNVSDVNSDNSTQASVTMARSSKLSRQSTFYYYEPPPSVHYLPPPINTIPFEYTTPSPTDEEFINKPSHDEIPQDIPDTLFHGYHYEVPNIPLDGLLPPISHDEPFPVTPSTQYLPADNIGNSPLYGVHIAKTPKTNVHTRITPPVSSDDGQIPVQNQRDPLHVEVTEMHCFDTPTDGKFHAVLTVKSTNENLPVFEDIFQPDVSSCVVKSDSQPLRFNSKLNILVSKAQFKECGVRDCSITSDVVHLCFRLRFPTIPKMKLAEDAVLTLQCRTQDRVAAHTKHLAINIENAVSARSSDVARGGGRGGLRSRVSLFRRGPRGHYSEPLPRGARVPLGELLMLRALIEPEDGWQASRLSSVSLSGNSGGSMSLLGTDGCRETRARALCPREQINVPPLGHSLLIRAALFEGMRSGEEVKLSVRLVACLDAADCRTPKCPNPTSARNKRNADKEGRQHMMGNQTLDTTSVLEFKVILPQEDIEISDKNSQTKAPLIIMLLVLSTGIICSSILIFYKKQRI